jgi:hypothetical protein
MSAAERSPAVLFDIDGSPGRSLIVEMNTIASPAIS